MGPAVARKKAIKYQNQQFDSDRKDPHQGRVIDQSEKAQISTTAPHQKRPGSGGRKETVDIDTGAQNCGGVVVIIATTRESRSRESQQKGKVDYQDGKCYA